MLIPKRVKHRKQMRGRRRGYSKGGTNVDFGEFGLKALEDGWVTGRQIEAARIAINRHLNRRGRVWIRFFPDKPISKKPLEVRMGKGKGNTDAWVATVRPGRVLFEISGCTENMAREALCKAAAKLSIKTKFIIRS